MRRQCKFDSIFGTPAVLCMAYLVLGMGLSAAEDRTQIITFDAPGAGTGAGQGTYVSGISAGGAIAGNYVDGNNVNHGFLRTPDGTIVTFDVPGAGTGAGQGTLAFAINSSQEAVGRYFDGNGISHAFLRTRQGDIITAFDPPDTGQGSFACDVNDAGEISGDYNTGLWVGGTWQAFLRHKDGTITEYSVGQDITCWGYFGLSPTGWVTGVSVDQDTFQAIGYLRAPDGSVTTFDAPGAGPGPFQGTYPDAINLELTVAGNTTDANNVNHGFLRRVDGKFTIFDPPGAGTGAGQGTYANSVNLIGAIVGEFIDANNVNHGYSREPGAEGGFITFDVPGAGTGAGQGTLPAGGNDAGAIAGYYFDGSGVSHGFLRR